MDLGEKLEILAGAARYDASCASSGTQRPGPGRSGGIGSTMPSGICHSWADDGRCISLLKVLLTNHCMYDCAYCANRRSNDTRRARFSVGELVELTMGFYQRNYIEGLFLSSGVVGSPDRTMEELGLVARSLREDHGFAGYIHLKAIPGADSRLVYEAGLWADRMSVNIELPSRESLANLAPDKSARDIFAPMAYIGSEIRNSRELAARRGRYHTLSEDSRFRLPAKPFGENIGGHPQEFRDAPVTVTQALSGPGASTGSLPATARPAKSPEHFIPDHDYGPQSGADSTPFPAIPSPDPDFVAMPGIHEADPALAPAPSQTHPGTPLSRPGRAPVFVPAGQSTQMIVGASPESDFRILTLSEDLYRRFSLKRVYFSAYIPVNSDERLPATTRPPLLREHRLYQADWLMRFYQFRAGELLDPANPDFDPELDPKTFWALGHPEFFPVDIQTAPPSTLLRIPGVGPLSARRIHNARRTRRLDIGDLASLGVVLKRARYFLVCRDHRPGKEGRDTNMLRRLLSDPAAKKLQPSQLELF